MILIFFIVAIGIVGATVMPHGLFLGSSLATQDRVSLPPPKEIHVHDLDSVDALPCPSTCSIVKENFFTVKRWLLASLRSWRVSDAEEQNLPDDKLGHAGWKNNTLPFVREHLRHGITDVVMSLLGFAVAINSLSVL